MVASRQFCYRPPEAMLLLVVAGMLLTELIGCQGLRKMVAPSNVRHWSPDQQVLPFAEYHGREVTVHNIRNCQYFGEDTYVVNHYDRTYQLDQLAAVDFFMVPFEGMPYLAHTMLSFEFRPPRGNPQYLAVSVEIRKEKGESYATWKGSARQFELTYVLADERDVVQLRTNHRGEQVYRYRTNATPEMSQRLLVDVLGRVNELASRPEFYDTVSNNCTTNIVRHINRIKPDRIEYDARILLPGYSDKLAYDEGLIQRHGTFEQTKALALVNPRALAAAGRDDFSQVIRR
jgi:hypothetical protein